MPLDGVLRKSVHVPGRLFSSARKRRAGSRISSLATKERSRFSTTSEDRLPSSWSARSSWEESSRSGRVPSNSRAGRIRNPATIGPYRCHLSGESGRNGPFQHGVDGGRPLRTLASAALGAGSSHRPGRALRRTHCYRGRSCRTLSRPEIPDRVCSREGVNSGAGDAPAAARGVELEGGPGLLPRASNLCPVLPPRKGRRHASDSFDTGPRNGLSGPSADTHRASNAPGYTPRARMASALVLIMILTSVPQAGGAASAAFSK